MTRLNFCNKCGAKRVRDVKEELENLIFQQDSQPVYTADECALCLRTLKKPRKRKPLKRTKDDSSVVAEQLSKSKKRTKDDTSSMTDTPSKSRKLIESDLDVTRTDNKIGEKEKGVPKKIIIKSEPKEEETSEKGDTHEEDQNIPIVLIKNEDNQSGNIGSESENKSEENLSSNGEDIESQAQDANVSVDDKNDTADEDGKKTSNGLKCDYESVVADMDPRVRECITKSNDSKQQFQCANCDKKFAFVIAMTRHIRKFHPTVVHLTDNKIFKCNLCDAHFNRRTNLKNHRLLHSDYRPFKCSYPQCLMAFKDKHTLAGHELTHTGLGKHYSCQYCSKTFRKSNQLKMHVMIHTGVKPYMCKFCGYCFTQKQNLKTHERRHTEEKPFRCNQCDRAFYQPTHLKAHLMDHTGERPVVCEICGYSCKTKGLLKNHMSVHNPDKPHKCDKCDFATKRKENLTKHQISHMSDRPFQCDYCKQVFKLKDTLLVHQKRHMDSEGNIQPHDKRKPPRFRPAKYNVKSRRQKLDKVNTQSNAVMYDSTVMDLSAVDGPQERPSVTSDGHIVFPVPYPSYIQGASTSGLIIPPHHMIAQKTVVQSSSDINRDYETVDVSLKGL